MTDEIEIKLVRSTFLTRWPCHVCGGCTEKEPILAEGEWMAPDGKRVTVRVCETCLKEGDIDERLGEHARALESFAADIRGLVGRLLVPSYADWRAAVEADEAEYIREMESNAV